MQTSALPLGYTATFIFFSALRLGRYVGIEPTYAGSTNQCVNHFTNTAILLTGIVGIEPTPTVLETVVLPLNYIPIMEESGFEPPNSERAVLQTAAFSHFAIPPFKWRGTESNRRHKELQSFALPTELPSHLTVHAGFEPAISSVTGRRDKPLLQWTILREPDLNQRPSGYEPDELPDCSIPR